MGPCRGCPNRFLSSRTGLPKRERHIVSCHWEASALWPRLFSCSLSLGHHRSRPYSVPCKCHSHVGIGDECCLSFPDSHPHRQDVFSALSYDSRCEADGSITVPIIYSRDNASQCPSTKEPAHLSRPCDPRRRHSTYLHLAQHRAKRVATSQHSPGTSTPSRAQMPRIGGDANGIPKYRFPCDGLLPLQPRGIAILYILETSLAI